MFKVRKLGYRPWPVTVTLMDCNESGEVTELKQTFVGHFAMLPEKEITAISDQVFGSEEKTGDDSAPAPKPLSETLSEMLEKNAKFFCKMLVGWGKEVVDENKTPIPFSAEALTTIVTGPDGIAFSAGINRAIFEFRHGIKPELEKNSPASPVDGPKTAEAEASETASS